MIKEIIIRSRVYDDDKKRGGRICFKMAAGLDRKLSRAIIRMIVYIWMPEYLTAQKANLN